DDVAEPRLLAKQLREGLQDFVEPLVPLLAGEASHRDQHPTAFEPVAAREGDIARSRVVLAQVDAVRKDAEVLYGHAAPRRKPLGRVPADRSHPVGPPQKAPYQPVWMRTPDLDAMHDQKERAPFESGHRPGQWKESDVAADDEVQRVPNPVHNALHRGHDSVPAPGGITTNVTHDRSSRRL